MRKLLLILLILFSVSSAQAAIAFVNTASNDNGASASPPAFTISTSTGNCVVVVVGARSGSAVSVSSVVDSGGSTYTRRVAPAVQDNANIEIWSTTATGSIASTTLTVTLSAAPQQNSVTLVNQYSGVSSLGTTASFGSIVSTDNTPTVSLTIQDANNWVVAGMELTDNNAADAITTFTVGNLRNHLESTTGNFNSGAIGDNTNASSGVGVTNTGQGTNGTPDARWNAAALELRCTGACASGAAASGINKRYKLQTIDP